MYSSSLEGRFVVGSSSLTQDDEPIICAKAWLPAGMSNAEALRAIIEELSLESGKSFRAIVAEVIAQDIVHRQDLPTYTAPGERVHRRRVNGLHRMYSVTDEPDNKEDVLSSRVLDDDASAMDDDNNPENFIFDLRDGFDDLGLNRDSIEPIKNLGGRPRKSDAAWIQETGANFQKLDSDVSARIELQKHINETFPATLKKQPDESKPRTHMDIHLHVIERAQRKSGLPGQMSSDGTVTVGLKKRAEALKQQRRPKRPRGS